MKDFKKKLSYIWYYYKVPIIIAVLVLMLTIDVIVTKAHTVTYDHKIAIISKEYFPSQEKVDELKETFEQKYDGTFDVVLYRIDLSDNNLDEVTTSKLELDLGNKLSEYLFIYDIDTFNIATNNMQFKSLEKVSDVEWLKNKFELDEFYFAIR